MIGRSVGTYIFLCFSLLDRWLHIENSWYHYHWCMFGYCIRLRHWHVDYIDWSFRLSSRIDSSWCMTNLLTLTCTFFLLLILFILTCLIILLSWTCKFSFLYISFILTWLILFVVYYLVCLDILSILLYTYLVYLIST